MERLNELEKNVAHRAAKLYKFDKKKYKKLQNKGFNFEIQHSEKVIFKLQNNRTAAV